MRQNSANTIRLSHQRTIKLLTIAVSSIIITSSIMLFISDRGNLISLASENIYGWKNPTYEDMQLFLSIDKTNENEFVKQTYECEQFSTDLIKNARKFGFRAGYVSLHNPYGYDHAIVCFDTRDKGLLFIEPQNDIIMTEDEMDNMVLIGKYTQGIDSNDMKLNSIPLSDYTISWYMII